MRPTLSWLARPRPAIPNLPTKSRRPPKVTVYSPTDDIVPGQHVIKVCKEHDIGLPRSMRPLRCIPKGQNPHQLSLAISQQHCFTKRSMRYLDTVEHPFAKSMMALFVKKKNEPLWIEWEVYGASPFPNSKAGRKLIHALRDALSAAGYDRAGRRIIAEGESSAIADLHGSLRIVSADPLGLYNAKFEDLLTYGKQIVRGLELELRRDKDGQHIVKQMPHQSQQRPNYSPRGGAWNGQGGENRVGAPLRFEWKKK